MGTKPSEVKIASEILELTQLKPLIRSRSAFGDDNRANLQAEIDVLSDLSLQNEDAIYDRFQPTNEDGSPDDSGELDAALGALRWLKGEGGDPTLSESWRPLVR